jgi:dimeric dUTPase (all-alpha-NTP-PPase superfamily)
LQILIGRVLQEVQRLKEVTSLEAKDTTSALMVKKGKLNSKEKCFKCGKDALMVKKGKLNSKEKCFKCGKDGHMKANCNMKKNKNEDKGF